METLRRKVWAVAYSDKEEIKKLVLAPPLHLSQRNIFLIYRCVFLVAFELKIKEIEIKILEGDYFEKNQ
jgi:hypothetical protein